MDAISQRKLVAAVAVGIVSKQLYDIYGYFFEHNSGYSSTTLIHWCIIYICFFLSLWFFQVERLQFRFLAIIVFSILSIFWNIGIFEVTKFLHGEPYSLTILKNDAPVVITQEKESIKIDHNENLGSHYIHFVPYARGVFNPNGDAFCISDYNTKVEVPLLIKGVPPYKIKYEFTNFNTNKTTINEHEFSVTNEKINIDDKPKVRRHVLPIKAPGKVHLISVSDEIYGEGKVDTKNSKDAYIINCPNASLTESFVEVCVEDSYDINFLASGFGPLNVYYTKKVNNEDAILNMFQSGTISKENDVQKQHEIRDSIHFDFPTPGSYLFKIATVMDNLNNTVWYTNNKLTLSKIPGYEVFSNNAKDISTLINVRPKPTAKLESKDTNLLLNQKAKVKVILEGTGPWTITYAFLEDKTEIVPELIEKNKIVIDNIQQNNYVINIDKPGIFKLLSVTDAYCKGEILLPSDSLVQLIYPPEVEITKEPIYESCPDPIGMRFNVTFVGEPPFKLKYSYTNENTGESKIENIISNQSRFIFNGTPKVPGKYAYSFLSLNDANYFNVPVNITETTFPVHPPSDAIFLKTDKIYSCVGETVTLPIRLSGTGPWSLTYDILYGRIRTSKTISNISSSNYDLITEKFDQSGSYSYELSSIIDANGCIKNIQHSSPIIIEVFGHTPKAYFAGETDESRRQYITLDDPNGVYLPVRLEGKPPFDLNYTLINEDKLIVDKSIWNQNALLKVYKPGVYELRGIHDKYCPGIVENPRQFEVRGILRPTIEIVENEVTKICKSEDSCILSRTTICENESDSLGIKMTGKPPFIVKYSITDEKGKESVFTETLSQYDSRLSLYSKAVKGNYTIKILSIADANYSKPSKVNEVVQQEVKSKPRASFITNKKLFQCVGEDTSDLEIVLQGETPFTVKFSYRYNGKHDTFEIKDINTQIFKFSINEYIKDVGIYSFYIRNVIDGSGCIYEEEETNDKAAFVEVSDVAKIWSTSAPEVCVGDMLYYTLSGIGPFKVYYSLNDGEEVPVTASDNQLKLRTGEPGIVTITRACNVMGCCSKPIGLSHVIHSWPTAKINDGKDIIEELREDEGDMGKIRVDFTGVPPFDFTYSHKILNVGIHKSSDINSISPQDIKSEKQVSIVGINDYKYVFESSEEGLYMVSSISDKYCGNRQSYSNQSEEKVEDSSNTKDKKTGESN
ncbi:hypothetical protein BCR36DRAFT_360594 [Piromyces finnis]|uniref:Nucleoporin Pom152 n=1 Tax=Piromyces finnis TaxID=1754191 RepID=A0A1Y1V0I9_9FUNG|nr:hypothetical protein BCR36DRAFT_360594 [Piromyces finnis]|eukprot:ORX43789.1 hypothetical protein BCR36DRAFT_360594 [Piromyces finnis]